MLMLGMAGAMGGLLQLGGTTEANPTAGFLPAPARSNVENGWHERADTPAENTSIATRDHPAAPAAYPGLASPASAPSSSTPATSGFKAWIGSLWSSGEAETPAQAQTDVRGPVGGTALTAIHGSAGEVQVASSVQVTFTPIREVPNEQRMQPGDDSSYLNDGAPGEEAGGSIEERP